MKNCEDRGSSYVPKPSSSSSYSSSSFSFSFSSSSFPSSFLFLFYRPGVSVGYNLLHVITDFVGAWNTKEQVHSYSSSYLQQILHQYDTKMQGWKMSLKRMFIACAGPGSKLKAWKPGGGESQLWSYSIHYYLV